MKTKSILISYTGYPYSIRSLYLDNGLANLASCLIREEHQTVIFDYSTVNIIKELFPQHLREKWKRIMSLIREELKEHKDINSDTVIYLGELEKEIEEHKNNYIKKTAYELANYIKQNKIDFIGFKLWAGEGFLGSIKLAEAVKRYVRIPVFGGGPQVDWFGELIFKATDAFDVLAYGEGEETIVKLADYTTGKIELQEIPNIIYKASGNVVRTQKKLIEDFNSIPLPNYEEDVYPSTKGNNKIKMISFEECRGCPNSCNFCIHPRKSGRKWRVKDSKKVVEDIAQLVKKFNMRVFKFTGSNPPPFVKNEIAKEIINRKINIRYSSFAHVKGMEIEDYRVLKESGCNALFFGVESGSDRILKEAVNKPFRKKDIVKALKCCKESGISIITSIITPMPGETDETLLETLNLLKETEPDLVLVNPPFLEPASKWAIENEKYGFKIENKEKLFYKEMMYITKFSYPAVLWDDLDGYKLNGITFKESLNKAEEFSKVLMKEGLLSFGSDDLFLLSDSSNMEIKKLLKNVQESLLNADYEKMQDLAKNINDKISNLDN